MSTIKYPRELSSGKLVSADAILSNLIYCDEENGKISPCRIDLNCDSVRSYRDSFDFVVTKNGQHSNECCSQCTFLNNPALIVVEVAIVTGSNRLDNIVLDEIIQDGDQAFQLEAIIYHGSNHYILRSKNSNDCIFELIDMTRKKYLSVVVSTEHPYKQTIDFHFALAVRRRANQQKLQIYSSCILKPKTN